MKFARFLILLPLLASAACSSTPPASDASSQGISTSDETAIKAAVASSARPEANRARDAYRHPAETLSFFGLKQDMTVLELSPGNGWYTEILAPILAEKGKLIVTSFDLNGPDKAPYTYARQLAARFQQDPALFSKVGIQVLEPPTNFDFGPDSSVDMVLTFRSTHGWVRDGQAEKLYASVFKVLKPGGILGIEQHRGNADADPAQAGKTGYLSEDYVIKLIEGAGFKLAGKSEINANPKDTKDYPEGVWNLPPSLKSQDQDRDKYMAIGESDRMTLKFVKPAR